ncbi:MAG: hypothetical protein ABJB97_07335, partial [Acidobacteriota bacterium]
MSETTAEKTVSALLLESKVELAPATYVLAGVRPADWTRLLESPELSPNTETPFMIFRDAREVTLLIEEEDWKRIHHAVRDARVEGDFRLLTFDIELPWNVVGFLARVTEILAAAEISAGVLSS